MNRIHIVIRLARITRSKHQRTIHTTNKKRQHCTTMEPAYYFCQCIVVIGTMLEIHTCPESTFPHQRRGYAGSHNSKSFYVERSRKKALKQIAIICHVCQTTTKILLPIVSTFHKLLFKKLRTFSKTPQ